MAEAQIVEKIRDYVSYMNGVDGRPEHHNHRSSLFKFFKEAYDHDEAKRLLTRDRLCLALEDHERSQDPKAKELIEQTASMLSEWRYAWDRYDRVCHG